MSVSSGLDTGAKKRIFSPVSIGGASGATNLAHNLNSVNFTYEVREISTGNKIMLPLVIIDANNVEIESTLSAAISVTVTIIG